MVHLKLIDSVRIGRSSLKENFVMSYSPLQEYRMKIFQTKMWRNLFKAIISISN